MQRAARTTAAAVVVGRQRGAVVARHMFSLHVHTSSQQSNGGGQMATTTCLGCAHLRGASLSWQVRRGLASQRPLHQQLATSQRGLGPRASLTSSTRASSQLQQQLDRTLLHASSVTAPLSAQREQCHEQQETGDARHHADQRRGTAPSPAPLTTASDMSRRQLKRVRKQLKQHVESGQYDRVVAFVRALVRSLLEGAGRGGHAQNTATGTAADAAARTGGGSNHGTVNRADSSHTPRHRVAHSTEQQRQPRQPRQRTLDGPSMCMVVEAMTAALDVREVLELTTQLRATNHAFPRQAPAVFIEQLMRKHFARTPHAHNDNVSDDYDDDGATSRDGRDDQTMPTSQPPHSPDAAPQRWTRHPITATAAAAPAMRGRDAVSLFLEFRRLTGTTLSAALVDEVGRRLRHVVPPGVLRDVLHGLAWELARRGLHMPPRAWHTYVVAVRRAGDVGDVGDVLDLAEQTRVRLNRHQYALLLQLASGCRREELVEHVFQHMCDNGVEPAVWAWSERMRCFALRGDVAKVEGMIQEMKRLRLVLLPAVFHRFLEAHVHAGDLSGAEQVYNIFVRTGHKVHPALLLPLLRAYLEEHRPDAALSVLVRMRTHALHVRSSDIDAIIDMYTANRDVAGLLKARAFRDAINKA